MLLVFLICATARHDHRGRNVADGAGLRRAPQWSIKPSRTSMSPRTTRRNLRCHRQQPRWPLGFRF